MADARRPRKKKVAPGAADGLRRQAEERLDGLSAGAAPIAAPAPEDLAAVVHELHVHQTELELQNEELRRAQLDLDAQLEKYLELFDLAPVGYVALDDPGIVRDANLTAAHLLGAERQQLVGKPLSAFVFAADRAVYYLHLRSLRETGWPQSCELRLQSAGAAPFWAHLEWRPRRAAHGEPLRYHLTFTDVHERVVAEEALRESEAKFRDVVERATDGIAILQGGLVMFVNEALARMAGYSVGELTGASFLIVVQDEEHAEIADRVRRRIAGEQLPTTYELDLVRKDGTLFTAEVRAGVVPYEGAPAELALLRDISERKRAEEALRESEERFALALEGAGAGLWDWDMVKDQVVYSTRWKRMLGYEDHEVEDAFSGWKDLWHPDDRPRIEKALDDYLSGKTSDYEIVHRLRHKDGTWRWIVTRGGIIRDPAGKPLRWVGTNIDVTAGKQAEEELRVKDRAVESAINAIAISDLAGNLDYVNPAFLKLWGYDSAAEVLGRPATTFWRMGEEAAEVVEALRARGGWIGELVGRRKEGALFDAQVGASMVVDAGGQPIRMLASFADVTERKRSEAALRESERLYRSLFDNMLNGFAHCEMHFDDQGAPWDFTYLAVNEAFESHTGLRDVVGKKVSEVIPGIRETDPELLAAYGRVANGGPPESFEMFVDALRMWFSISVYCPEHGFFVAVFDVITERKQAEEKLAQSRDLLANLARLVPGVVYQYRLYPDGRSAFPYSSPGMNDIYECTSEEVREDATPVFGRLHPDDYDRVGDTIQESARTLQTFYCEFRVVLPRQGLRWRWSQAQPERMEDGGTLWHGIISDITERKQAEEEVRRQAEQLRRTVEGAVLAISLVVETRDPYTAGHERRVSELATAIAREMGMDGEALEALRLGGLIHDVGKIAVPAEILSKPGRLSEIELELIKQHSQAGFDILAAIDFGLPVAEMVLQHHERLDGSGYPRGLSGEDVLPEARILAVADVVEAMSSHRPYRPALGMEAALAEVKEHAGVKYDADVVATCVRLVEEQGFAFTP